VFGKKKRDIERRAREVVGEIEKLVQATHEVLETSGDQPVATLWTQNLESARVDGYPKVFSLASEVLHHVRVRLATELTGTSLESLLQNADQIQERILLLMEATLRESEDVSVRKPRGREAGELQEGEVISVLHHGLLELEMLTWVIGADIDLADVREQFDHENRVLYAMTKFEAGEAETYVLGRKAHELLLAM